MKKYKSSDLTHKRAEVFREAEKNGVIIQECRTNGEVVNELVLIKKSELDDEFYDKGVRFPHVEWVSADAQIEPVKNIDSIDFDQGFVQAEKDFKIHAPELEDNSSTTSGSVNGDMVTVSGCGVDSLGRNVTGGLAFDGSKAVGDIELQVFSTKASQE